MAGEDEPRLFIEVRGVGPSDFPGAEAGHPTDEAVALANDIHDLLREEYDKTDVTGVVPVVNPDAHEQVVSQC
jgi:hypothetical protein